MSTQNIVSRASTGSTPAREDLSKWAKFQLDRNNLFFPYLESRVAVVLTINVGLLAILGLNLPGQLWQVIARFQAAVVGSFNTQIVIILALGLLSILTVAAILRGLYLVYRVYVPLSRDRKKGEKTLGLNQYGEPLVSYFRGIARFPTPQDYINTLVGPEGQGRCAEDLAEEVHRTSCWLTRGYDYLNASYIATGAALVFSLLTIALCAVLNHGVRIVPTP